MKQNVTVQLDQAIIHDAKVLAARRSSSLSKLLSDQIRLIAAQEANYEHTKKLALIRLNKGYALGGTKLPTREEIYRR